MLRHNSYQFIYQSDTSYASLPGQEAEHAVSRNMNTIKSKRMEHCGQYDVEFNY